MPETKYSHEAYRSSAIEARVFVKDPLCLRHDQFWHLNILLQLRPNRLGDGISNQHIVCRIKRKCGYSFFCVKVVLLHPQIYFFWWCQIHFTINFYYRRYRDKGIGIRFGVKTLRSLPWSLACLEPNAYSVTGLLLSCARMYRCHMASTFRRIW